MATPIRHIRVPDEEWEEWAVDADRSELSVSAWVRAVCANQLLQRPCRRLEIVGEISEVSSDEGVVSAEIIVTPDEG